MPNSDLIRRESGIPARRARALLEEFQQYEETGTPLSQLQKAVRTARVGYNELYRRGNDEPYFNHPARVAKNVRLAGYDEETQAAAYLHDIIEKAGFSRTELELLGFSETIIRLVESLSYDRRSKGVKYLDEIERALNECPEELREQHCIIRLFDVGDNQDEHRFTNTNTINAGQRIRWNTLYPLTASFLLATLNGETGKSPNLLRFMRDPASSCPSDLRVEFFIAREYTFPPGTTVALIDRTL